MNSKSLFEIMKTFIAISVGLLITFLVIFLISDEPLVAIQMLVLGPLKNIRTFGNVIELMTPLMFTGIGMIIIYSSKQFNLAIDGAFHIGGLVASIVALTITLPSPIHPIVAILISGFAGAIITFIPFIIRHKTDANDFVVSIMLNYAVVLFASFILIYFFRDPSQGTFASFRFPDTVGLGILVRKTRIHWGFIVALVVVVATEFFLNQTTTGYKIRITGSNPNYAQYIGINTFKVILITQLLGGFIAGIGGGIEVLGMYDKFTWQNTMNFGWDGVIVSILAKNKPKFVPLTAFFLAYIRIGAFVMAMNTDVQNEIIHIAQGIIIIFIISENFLKKYKEKMLYKNAKIEIEGGEA